MKIDRMAWRTAVFALTCFGLTACATMDGLRAKWDAWTSRGAMVPLERLPVEDAIDANRFIIESPEQSVVGVPQVVFTREGNALPDFAREYGLGYDEVVAANPDTDIWLPGDNTPVLLPTQFVLPNVPREGIVLNIASKRLFYYPKDSIVRDPETGDIRSQVVMTFPIGIGRVGWETPLGSTLVTAKAVDPNWWVPASVRKEHAEMGDPLPAVVPPGPDNPLGSRVLQLDIPGYLIHGTNKPFGVGMRVSHGCVRLYPENIELLYELVAIGVPVKIINDPYLLGRLGDDWYFEAHAPLEDDTVGAPERLDALLADADDELSAREAEHVRVLASLASGVPVRISALDDAEVLARVRRVHNTIVHDPDAPTIDEAREMIEEAVAEAELVANVSRRRVSPSGVMPQL